jgi:hypothetical protein
MRKTCIIHAPSLHKQHSKSVIDVHAKMSITVEEVSLDPADRIKEYEAYNDPQTEVRKTTKVSVSAVAPKIRPEPLPTPQNIFSIAANKRSFGGSKMHRIRRENKRIGRLATVMALTSVRG